MTGLNFNFILYTAFRLAPFILVSFFSLSSILNQDLKGLIYLAGLLFASFLAIMIGNMDVFKKDVDTTDNDLICNVLTLTESGRLSNIPLSMVVFAYTFFYLVDIIAHYKLANQNIPTLIIFPLLIIGEFIWNRAYGCASLSAIIAAFGVGSLMGWAWSAMIRSTGVVQLQYFNGISNAAVCSRPSKQKFKCTTANA
uniref:Uncharacterized protein n=1 Tax=viral metagenome TaxID=1070528 RepID=A0A6C0KL06_9ZZZZ